MLYLYIVQNNEIIRMKDRNKIKSYLSNNSIVGYLSAIDPTDDELDVVSYLTKLHLGTLKNYTSLKHLPKIEEYQDYISTIMYDVKSIDGENCFVSSPISIIMTSSLVVTLSKEELMNKEDWMAKLSSDITGIFESSSSLYYTLLDIIVDYLFPILSCFENKLEELQEELITDNIKDTTLSIMNIRKNLLKLRKIFTYEQEVLYQLSHEDIKLLSPSKIPYMKDVFHHLEKLNANLEEYNGWASNLSDAFSNASSSKLNDKLNMLTIISFIFMPLSVLTGWYGMSFKNMPELQLDNGYYYFIGVVAIITVSIIVYFKKKKII